MYIKDVDVGTREISVDVIQWLSGDEANAAYFEETGDDSGAPNDYYIQNENPLVRRLSVVDDVPVTLAWFDDSEEPDGGNPFADPATFGDLPGYFEDRPYETPFWIEIRDGVVVKIEEQYVP